MNMVQKCRWRCWHLLKKEAKVIGQNKILNKTKGGIISLSETCWLITQNSTMHFCCAWSAGALFVSICYRNFPSLSTCWITSANMLQAVEFTYSWSLAQHETRQSPSSPSPVLAYLILQPQTLIHSFWSVEPDHSNISVHSHLWKFVPYKTRSNIWDHHVQLCISGW